MSFTMLFKKDTIVQLSTRESLKQTVNMKRSKEEIHLVELQKPVKIYFSGRRTMIKGLAD